ncbi:MAG TPA: Gfo/Idh/MocA family oxidoreductase [Pirellulales bacterium]|jgi:predicted dehydrogenase|nr:Gfo/Idh/MocA family oxidoreductase [Pirellulales bacterium]
MNPTHQPAAEAALPAAPSRRQFIKNTGTVAAATALASMAAPHVHAAEDNTIRIVLIGCGGRGTGAATDALNVKGAPIKLVAMADVFQDRLSDSHGFLKRTFHDRVDVPQERQFVGFDGYQKAMDCLKPGDIAIFTTPLAFRWVHFTYAIKKGLNVFMEKPLTADGPTSRKMLKLAEEAEAKNLKVGVGLMSRHSRAMQQLADRIHGGEIGDIVLMRAYRMHGPLAASQVLRKPESQTEVAFQIRNFHSFLWASGGCYSDFYIHHIDHCCWMKNAWPVSAQAVGGRHYRGDYVDQNFDLYAVEYIFADNTRFLMDGRCINGCAQIYNSSAHGTKGTAVISRGGDIGGPSATYKGLDTSNLIWESKLAADERNPYQNEWNDLVDAIRHDKPYNEVKRGVEASLVTSMGRMAAHTGQIITFDQILNSKHEFAPTVDKLTMNGPAPLTSDANGKYPVPQPGIVIDREYA